MLNKTLIHDVLQVAISNGANFAELFVENTVKNSVSMVNGAVENAQSGIDYGAGIRIFNGTNAIYSYTNDTSRDNLIRIAKQASLVIKGISTNIIMPFETRKKISMHPIKIMPSNIEKKEIIDFLKSGSESSFAYNKLITQTQCNYLDSVQDVLIANSQGLLVEDQRVLTRVSLSAVASSNNEKQTSSHRPGAHSGFELLKTLNPKQIGNDVAETAIRMLNADLCPSGKMPVIIDNGFGGVIFHEACGHSLEATAIAKGSSVFCDKIGQQIANEKVSAIDDGTLANHWGSLNVDDEGTSTQRNLLIENGILKSYLVDKLNGLKIGMKSTGSSRRESYRFAPTSRMTNTFIAPGNDSLKTIFANTEYGLYAKKMGGGSVRPATGEFNFTVLEGYLIKNGEITEPVRGATLIGKGSDVLMDIDMVSDNLAQDQGMCGSISGSIPTNVGQPMIRVKEIIVGGRK